ncbi:hypothetical protein [Nostoc sp.]
MKPSYKDGVSTQISDERAEQESQRADRLTAQLRRRGAACR